jgi:hypothetical protein
MAHVVAVFDPPLLLAQSGRVYTAQACGRQRDDGRWEGWLEFVPDDGSVVLRTERETTQRDLPDLEHWASTLGPVYLKGGLERVLTPPAVVVEEPQVPAVYDEPAPPRAVVTPIRTVETEPELDLFAEFTRDEEALARHLATFGPQYLRAIIEENNLGDATVDLDELTVPELVGWIIGALRWRLAS